MTKIPFLKWMPAGTPGGHINPRLLILHSDCANGSEPHPHDGLEWHAHVNYDGTGEQLVDTDLRADANYQANPFAISVETSSNVAATDPWTPAELKTIALICIWASLKYGIPLRPCTSWDGEGIGYHTMWGAPSHWTPVAKSCPGPARIHQFEHDLFPLIESLLNPPTKEEDMKPFLVRRSDDPNVWLTDLITKRHVAADEVDQLKFFVGDVSVIDPALSNWLGHVVDVGATTPAGVGTCQYLKPTTAVVSMNTPPSTGTISFN